MNEQQEHLKKQFKKHSGKSGVWFDKEKGIYRKSYKDRGWKMLKKISHKKARHSKTEKPTNKEFDIDWIYF